MTAQPDGPVYQSWAEAMADPDLDLSKPWFVAPDPAMDVLPSSAAEYADDAPFAWPEGWTEIGATEDPGSTP